MPSGPRPLLPPLRRHGPPLLLLALLCAVLYAHPAPGQELHGGARADALLAATPLRGDAWAANPAAPSTLEQPTLALSGGRRFGLAALRHGAAGVAVPLRPLVVAATAHTFGGGAYRETHLRAIGARGLRLGTTRRIHLGAALTYTHTAVEGYGAAGAVGLSLGTQVVVRPGLVAAVHGRNVNAPTLRGREPLPQALAVGLAIERPGLVVAVDVYDDVRFPLAVRAGVEAAPVAALALRAGVASVPQRYALGVGLRLARLTVDVAAVRHAVLGWSPSLALALLR